MTSRGIEGPERCQKINRLIYPCKRKMPRISQAQKLRHRAQLSKKSKYVQNIGRFEKCQSVADATFGVCTLVFGENGWGKSTLADLAAVVDYK